MVPYTAAELREIERTCYAPPIAIAWGPRPALRTTEPPAEKPQVSSPLKARRKATPEDAYDRHQPGF
jgi:hypothetical protein